MLVWELDIAEQLVVVASYGAPDHDQSLAFYRQLAGLDEIPYRPLIVVLFRADDEPAPRGVGDAIRRFVNAARAGASIPSIGIKPSMFQVAIKPDRIERVMWNALSGLGFAIAELPYARGPTVASWDDARAFAQQLRAGPVPRLDELRSLVLSRVS